MDYYYGMDTINRYIVGCKSAWSMNSRHSSSELIDTQWDVNLETSNTSLLEEEELIDTQWDVNRL